MSYKHDLHNDRFYDMVFHQKEGGYFVELGGLDGELHSQTHFLEKERKWKGIVVEPNPVWTADLYKNRDCIILTNPISDKKETVTFLNHVDIPTFSKIEDGSKLPPGEVEEMKMESVKLSTVLNKYKAPKVIDVLCLDIEGKEIDVLDEVLSNSKRKINLISLEHGDTHKVINFFYDKPYVKIKNPYMQFLKIDRKKQMLVRYYDGDFKYLDGQYYDGSLLDLEYVNWEFYYVHIDMLNEYPILKKFIEPINYYTWNI